jgi:hypothetical protein
MPADENGHADDPSTPNGEKTLWWAPKGVDTMPVEGRFDGQGVLMEATPKPAARDDVFDRALATLAQQVSVVCTWPDDYASRIDVVGAYRFLIVEFAPQDEVTLYLQLWSEPGDPVQFEVSSGHGHAPTSNYLTPQMRDALLGRGFEIGGAAKNFRKEVVAGGHETLQTLSRELLTIAIDVLGYDGSVALTYRLHQDSRLEHGRVFRGIQPHDFRRLLARWGIAAAFTPDGRPVLDARSAGLRFVVGFHVACAPPFSRFELVTLDAGFDVGKGDAARVAGEANARMTLGRAVAISPERILLSHTIVAGGGVTADNLRRQVLGWVEQVRHVIAGTAG